VRRSPVPLGPIVERFTARFEPVTPHAAVLRVWDEAVGPVVAAECRPTAVTGGVVTVSCSSAAWANELTLLSPTVVEQLNVALGERDAAMVRALRCRADGRR
jgi:predicted nucleic acid-binding Zn ribbon protein